MNADLERLIVLQAQDLELKKLRSELEEAPRRVSTAQQAVKKAEAALAASNTALTKEEILRRSQESDITDRRAKIVKLRKQMETATSAAQIAALEHEITFAEQTIAKLEDEEFASMERTELQEAAKETATPELERTKTHLSTEQEHEKNLKSAHTTRILALESERKALRAEISEDRLSIYDRVAKSRLTGVSEAVDHKCTACQMMVRPQRWNDLTGKDHEDELFTCESCGRILYWDPRRDAPVKFAPGERLTAAIATSEIKKAS